MVELLVVLVTIGVLVVIVLPNGIRQMQLYRLDTSVSTISGKVSEARMQAIKRNRTAWVNIDPTTRIAQNQTTDSTGATINIGFPERLPAGVSVTATSPIEIRFDSMGRNTIGTQSFTLVENNTVTAKDVTISPAGKVSAGQFFRYQNN